MKLKNILVKRIMIQIKMMKIQKFFQNISKKLQINIVSKKVILINQYKITIKIGIKKNKIKINKILLKVGKKNKI